MFGFRFRKKVNKETRARRDTRGELEKSYSFRIPRDEYRRGMWYVNGAHKADGKRLEKEEEMQRSTMD